jgi:hypothetical protein
MTHLRPIIQPVPEPVSPYLDDLVSAFRRSLRRQQKARAQRRPRHHVGTDVP